MQSNMWLQNLFFSLRLTGSCVRMVFERGNDMDTSLKLKKNDILLIVIIVVVAGLALLLHEVIGGEGAGMVTVKVDGKITGVYSLAEDREISINDGTNTLVIKDGAADMVWADCPDQLCVHQKAIDKNNESIICLPNKVVASIDSAENSAYDAVTN